MSHNIANGVDSRFVSQVADNAASTDTHSTSAVLHYCKRRILIPYQRFLSLLGWKSFVSTEDSLTCNRLTSNVYTAVVILFCLLGYVLQYAACYRRDIVNGYEKLHATTELNEAEPIVICKGTAMGLYFIPNLLHMTAYAYTFYLLRICETEQLQTLMERVFLQAFNSRSGYIMQHKLIRTLRIYLVFGIGWILLSISGQVMHLKADYPNFTWLQPSWKGGEIPLIITMMLSITWNDTIHIAIVMSYSIQCQLLISFLCGLHQRISEKSISLQEAVKDIHEASKMLKHLNEDFAISVSILMLHSGSLVVSGLVWLVNESNLYHSNALVIVSTVVCVAAWLGVFVFPLIQASRLSAACNGFKKVGLYLQTRPFGYGEFPQHNLDSFLLFTSSLDLQAKIFRVPVKPQLLFALLTVAGFSCLLLSQLDIISIGV